MFAQGADGGAGGRAALSAQKRRLSLHHTTSIAKTFKIYLFVRGAYRGHHLRVQSGGAGPEEIHYSFRRTDKDVSDATKTFVIDDLTFCGVNAIRLLSIGVQTERPSNRVAYPEILRVPGGGTDYFEGRAGRQIAGVVQVCPLKNERDVRIGSSEVFQGGNMQLLMKDVLVVEANAGTDEDFNIPVSSMVETERKEDVDTRAYLEVWVEGRDPTLPAKLVFPRVEIPRKGEPGFYPSPRNPTLELPAIKFMIDASGWGQDHFQDRLRENVLGELEPATDADGKIIYPSNLDVARLDVKIILEHIVTVPSPDRQMVGSCPLREEEHIETCTGRSCTMRGESCGGGGCSSTVKEFEYWGPHNRVSLTTSPISVRGCPNGGGERIIGADEKKTFAYQREVWLEPLYVAFGPVYEEWQKVNTDFTMEGGGVASRFGVKNDGSVVPRRGDGGKVLRVLEGEDLPNKPGTACSAASAIRENGWTWYAPQTFPSENDPLKTPVEYAGYCQLDYVPKDSSIGTDYICLNDLTELPPGWVYVPRFDAMVNGVDVRAGGGCRMAYECCLDTPEVEWGQGGSCSSPPTPEQYKCPYPEPTPRVFTPLVPGG